MVHCTTLYVTLRVEQHMAYAHETERMGQDVTVA